MSVATTQDGAHPSNELPLTELQSAYLIGRSLPTLGGTGCRLCWEFERARWDIDRLEAAWNRLVARHEALRAIFPGERSRVLESVPDYAIERFDLRKRKPGTAERELAALREEMLQSRDEPDRWPLFRIAVATTADGMRLFFAIDILAVDVSGIYRLLSEWARLHEDPNVELPPIDGTLRAAMERWQEGKRGERRQNAEAYWRARLDDLPRAPELPIATGDGLRFKRHQARLKKKTWKRFQRHARARGLKRVASVITAFTQVLGRWAAHNRFAINVTVAAPPGPVAPDSVIGDFTSNLLLAVDGAAAPSFAGRAREIGQRLSEDRTHVRMGGVELLSELSSRRGEQVLMPVVFSSFLHPHADLKSLGRFVTGLTRTPQVTLDAQIMEDGHGLCLSWDVLDGYYPQGQIEGMFELWVALLKRLGKEESAWDEAVTLPLPASQREVRERVNATAEPWPPERLHARVLAQAERTPQRPAVIGTDTHLTYREVVGRAAAYADALREAGVQRNELVAVILEKGWRQVVAVLGVQMSGAAYLPIDIAAPRARIDELLKLGACRFAIADGKMELPAGVHGVALDEAAVGVPTAGPATADDLAYVIFTSGSTGTPKGVMIRHRAAANTVRDINQRFAVGEADRVIGLSALNFDLSVWDIFGTLSAGAALVLPDAGGLRDPGYLAQRVETEGVTLWNSVPSYLQLLAEAGGDRRRLRSLRLAMLSGDWIPLALPSQLEVPIVSLGGATEAAVWSIFHPIEGVDPDWRSIPYGKPLSNQRFHVLDKNMAPCPDGVPGELYIAGEGLADGYWRDEAQTAASFVTHPRSGERLYRTGDWGAYFPDGNIQFLGRHDGQVKISGHRIELGEVEAALGRCAGVEQAVAVTFTDEYGQKRLAAFYSGVGDDTRVRAQLSQCLPAYMVPQRLLPQETIPLTANGKIDRKTLAARAATPSPSPSPAPSPAPSATIPAQPLERLFGADGVLGDGPPRKAFAIASSGVRQDLPRTGAVPLHSHGEIPLPAAWGRSVRAYDGPVSLDQLGRLLLGLRAVDREGRLRRAYASAGDTSSVQVYVQASNAAVTALADGLYYYHPVAHELLPVAPDEGLDEQLHLPGNQPMVRRAAFTLYFFSDLTQLQPLYGDMAEPFAWMEAGHMTQILRQSAEELNLGLCLIGAYDALPVLRALGLSHHHYPLTAMVGGLPAEDEGAPAMAPGNREPVKKQAVATTAPATSGLADQIAAIWCECLKLPAVGHDERFFEVGGTSFSMLAVQQALEKRLHRQVSVTELFRHTTVSQLARYLTQRDQPAALPAEPAPVPEEQTRSAAGTLSRKRDLRRSLRRAAASR